MIDTDAALAALSLEDKCRLLAGKTTWRTKEFPHAGIPSVKMSDGPNGVRGEGHGGSSTPGVVVPSGITLGASWDPGLLERIGELLGTEAQRKGAHILLGPTVNIHRTPVGGRTFECYSEDPELSGALAAAYVRGVQSKDVAVTVKHFACNDTEMDRMSVDVQVDDRPFREIYLRPFERAVKEGGAWGIMSAYNRLGGEHCAENHRLLTEILRDEWGFDGFVVSDWFGVHHTAEAANAGLNIEMPAPVRVYGDKLVAAVHAGEVSEEQVDRLVLDILLMMNRVHADERTATEETSVDDPTERALTRRAAICGTVLLRNEPVDGSPVLPFEASAVRSIAVIGPNAVTNQCMGGGSASLTPFNHRTLLAAVTDRFGPGTTTDATITFEPGVRTDRLTPVIRGGQLRQPNGEQGLLLEYINGTSWDGDVVVEDASPSSMVRFFGSIPAGVDPRAFAVRATGEFIPDTDGTHEVGVVSTGPIVVTAGGGDDRRVLVDDPDAQLPRSQEFFGYGSIEAVETMECTAGVPVPIELLWRTMAGNGFAAMRLGIRSPEPADLMDRAVAAATEADIAVVMVGTNDEWETEGFDRTTMDLPGRQDELVRLVCAANPNTAVIVNAGSPVTMDWATGAGAPAVLTSFFAGQEQAEALVDVLFGVADPGGRLPLTIPARLDDHPARENEGTNEGPYGKPVQRYEEGLNVGYRGYERRGVGPRFAFGHGLSYGVTEWAAPTADRTDVSVTDPAVQVSVPITATGDRYATVVVQGYVAAVDANVERPPKELRAFTKLVVEPGTDATATLTFDDRAFARWDADGGEWVIDRGDYDLVIAASAADERFRVRITIR